MCLMAIGPVIGLIGSAVSGIGAAQDAGQQAANYDAQAKAQQRQAVVTEQIGQYEGTRQSEAVNRVLGSQRAGFAANGLLLEGSPTDVIKDTATEGALDSAAIKWNAGMKADVSRYDARVSKMSANAARSSIPFAFLTPVLGGAARLAGAFSQPSGG